ncbi:fasciclin domain-containing protein [Paradesertivirga mongoliensis]|uniref:Fasciclin domain-containing protein n=1 Tax=Paradesertivirga mongoliensis TaxID=2100740 RepID=A0ABW4ZJA3_9SPHI|nr:fasciclin domain-containing protein [Pedobacter mongoliensis]
MKKVLKTSSFLLVLLALFSACNKKGWDEYYGRPDDLASPIYQQLQARNNFNSFLVLVDKAGYKDILSKAGYWTIFAPNDEAVARYLQENNISDVNAVKDSVARKIVRYSLAYNSFKSDRLDDYQSGIGWAADKAYKRRTTFYAALDTAMIDGKKVLVSASNRNNAGGTYYVSADNNNKYIPFFLNSYFTANGIPTSDYAYLFPGKTFSGFNVADAQVVNKDIIAENGVIHEIDRVILPLPSIDQYLSTAPEYSKFKKVFDDHMVSYLINASATAKNKEITGSNLDVYVKVYNGMLPFSPNNENFLKVEDNDGQMDGYTMFAPTNEAFESYTRDTLLKHYLTFEALPDEIISDFLMAHMWRTTVWPSKFSVTKNLQGEGALFNLATDIVDKKVLSNGIFYGTNKAQSANVFSSVFGKAYLNPNYSLMTRALSVALKTNIINTNSKYTLFLISDDDLTAAGYSYNLDANRWEYRPPGGGTTLTGTSAWDKLNRILNTHVVRQDLTDITGSGIIETYNGEYIKYNGNTVFSAGNQDANVTRAASGEEAASNGTVYYVNGLLNESTLSIGKHIEKLAATTGSNFKKFFDYLKASNIYNTSNGEILGVSAGSLYTVFVPNNAGIDAAIAQGYLPSSPTSSSADDKEKVANFIRYHILQKETVVVDGKKEGGYPTLLQKENGAITAITIANTATSMQVTDMKAGTVNVLVPSSNNLSNRAVIHLINGFLKFDTK